SWMASRIVSRYSATLAASAGGISSTLIGGTSAGRSRASTARPGPRLGQPHRHPHGHAVAEPHDERVAPGADAAQAAQPHVARPLRHPRRARVHAPAALQAEVHARFAAAERA